MDNTQYDYELHIKKDVDIIMPYFKLPSQCMTVKTEKNHDKCQASQSQAGVINGNP